MSRFYYAANNDEGELVGLFDSVEKRDRFVEESNAVIGFSEYRAVEAPIPVNPSPLCRAYLLSLSIDGMLLDGRWTYSTEGAAPEVTYLPPLVSNGKRLSLKITTDDSWKAVDLARHAYRLISAKEAWGDEEKTSRALAALAHPAT